MFLLEESLEENPKLKANTQQDPASKVEAMGPWYGPLALLRDLKGCK